MFAALQGKNPAPYKLEVGQVQFSLILDYMRNLGVELPPHVKKKTLHKTMKSLGFTNQDIVDDCSFQSRTRKIEKYVDTIQELICSLPHGAKKQGFLEELHDSRLLVLEKERVQNEKEGAMIEYKTRCMDAALFLFRNNKRPTYLI